MRNFLDVIKSIFGDHAYTDDCDIVQPTPSGDQPTVASYTVYADGTRMRITYRDARAPTDHIHPAL